MARARRLIAVILLTVFVSSVGCVAKTPPNDAPTPPDEEEQTAR